MAVAHFGVLAQHIRADAAQAAHLRALAIERVFDRVGQHIYCLQFNSQFIKARPNAGFLFTLLKVQQREVRAHALLQCG